MLDVAWVVDQIISWFFLRPRQTCFPFFYFTPMTIVLKFVHRFEYLGEVSYINVRKSVIAHLVICIVLSISNSYTDYGKMTNWTVILVCIKIAAIAELMEFKPLVKNKLRNHSSFLIWANMAGVTLYMVTLWTLFHISPIIMRLVGLHHQPH